MAYSQVDDGERRVLRDSEAAWTPSGRHGVRAPCFGQEIRALKPHPPHPPNSVYPRSRCQSFSLAHHTLLNISRKCGCAVCGANRGINNSCAPFPSPSPFNHLSRALSLSATTHPSSPAVLDYGLFSTVAAQHGLRVTNLCGATATRQLIEETCGEAGFSFVRVEEERKVRYYYDLPSIQSPMDYAQSMEMHLLSPGNPFISFDSCTLSPAQLEALRSDLVHAIAESAMGRLEGPGKGVRSPYTVFHVIARP